MGTAAETLITVRQMTLADIPAVYEIEKISFAEAWQAEYFQQYLQVANTAGLVAEFENKIVAYVTLTFFEGFTAISKFAVAPEFRRRTLGKQFLEFILKLICQRGGVLVKLHVNTKNIAAIHLYESCGFKVIGRIENFYPSIHENAFLMERKI